jgi:putative heme-binding domain-containing protein
LADADPRVAGEPLLALVTPRQPAEVQSAAIRAIKHLHDPALIGRLVQADRFATFSPALREEVLSALFSQPEYLGALLSAIESAAVPVGLIDSLRRSQLTAHRDPLIRDRAARLLATAAVGDRAKVYEDYKSVLQLAPNAANGHQVFLKVCANCHRLDRAGTAVGPDLFGIRSQPKAAILLHILIPEYEITPGFGAYLLETTDGRVLAGLLVAETPLRVTLRQALGKEETVLRSNIESLTLSKLSLMPQELEKTLSRQDLADLVSYLKGERQ